MTIIRRSLSGGRVRFFVGLGLAVAFCFQCNSLISKFNQPGKVPGFGASPAIAEPDPAVLNAGDSVEDRIEKMARTAPLALLAEAQRRYRENVIDYTCTFRKQENIDGDMTKVQTIQAKYRELGHSVFVHWVKNPAKAERVIYVEGKWTSGDQPAALCQPAGAIARVLVKSIAMPIHGDAAKAASRRTIDQFGFRVGLELIIKYSLIAKEAGQLELTYTGQGEVGGRPTYVFERVLPYTGEGGKYPDRVLVYHLDTETLMPVMCASYADDAKEALLGQYEYTNVQLNVGLTDADFDGKTYKM
jgi:hypothetical protein